MKIQNDELESKNEKRKHELLKEVPTCTFFIKKKAKIQNLFSNILSKKYINLHRVKKISKLKKKNVKLKKVYNLKKIKKIKEQ